MRSLELADDFRCNSSVAMNMSQASVYYQIIHTDLSSPGKKDNVVCKNLTGTLHFLFGPGQCNYNIKEFFHMPRMGN